MKYLKTYENNVTDINGETIETILQAKKYNL